MKKVLFTSHVANFVKFNQPFMDLLKEQGYEIHYASMGEETIDCDKHFTVPFERSPFKVNNLKAIWQLKKIIDREGYDLIHTHTPMGSVVTRIAAMRTRKKAKTRVIYTAHGFHFFKGAPLLNWLTFYPVEKWLAKHTDVLITINQEDFALAKQRFSTDVRYVAGVGIDSEKFNFKMTKTEKNKVRQSLGLTLDDFVIIYPAELSKRKNQLWLMRSLAGIIKDNPKIHILLPGKDSLGGQCQALARDLGIENSIHFLGYRRDMPQLMRISDLAVSAALQEGLPVNLLEAMSVGLPIVATDCRGNRDLIQDTKNGFLIAQGDSATFAHSVMELFTNEGLRRSFGDMGKKLVKSYLLDDILPEVANAYEKKKRVLHLLNSNRFSGAENVVSEIIKNTNDTFDPLYCSPSGSINEALADRKIEHVPIRTLSYFEVRRVIKEVNPDIIHAHDFRASIVASLFSRKAKVVSHIHQNPDWLHSMNAKYILYKCVLKNFSKIFVVTDVIRSSRVFGGRQNVVVVHNKVDKKHIESKASVSDGKPYDVVFCGRLEVVKQPFDFIKVVAEIKKTKYDVRAAMIGDGSLMQGCRDLIKKLNLENNIDLLGFQSNPFKFVKRSNFLLITSSEEGFGLVAIEAMALGTVVLSYDLKSVKEILGKDVVTTFAHSPRELAELYQAYIANYVLYKNQLQYYQTRLPLFVKNDKSRYFMSEQYNEVMGL